VREGEDDKGLGQRRGIKERVSDGVVDEVPLAVCPFRGFLPEKSGNFGGKHWDRSRLSAGAPWQGSRGCSGDPCGSGRPRRSSCRGDLRAPAFHRASMLMPCTPDFGFVPTGVGAASAS
jgi:hypothetical protein